MKLTILTLSVGNRVAVLKCMSFHSVRHINAVLLSEYGADITDLMSVLFQISF